MADIFTIVSNLEVTADEVAAGELLSQQILQDRFPNIDWRQGTGVRDLVVRPNGVMLALINKGITAYFSQFGLDQITDTSPKELVDSIMSNVFISRNKGSQSMIRARLYFRFPADKPLVVQIPTTAFFSTDNLHRFYVEDAVTLYPSGSANIEGRTYFQYDSASTLWYADVDLISEDADESYNIEEGDLLYFTIFSPYFVNGSIQYLIDQAVGEETNTGMVQRSYSAISTRNLVNTPSIASKLTDSFNYLSHIHSEGMGDPNMYRDIVSVNSPVTPGQVVNFHIGGKVDVYMYTKPRTLLKQWVADVNGDIYMPGAIYSVVRSAITGSVDGDPDLIPFAAPYTTTFVEQSPYVNGVPTIPHQDIGLSADQMIKLSFGDAFPFKTASFVTKEYPNLSDVKALLDQQDDRVVCAGYLARGYEPHLLSINIDLHADTGVTEHAMETAVRSYIESIPNGGTLYISEIFGVLDRLKVYGVKAPLTVNAVHVNKGLVRTNYAVTDQKAIPITHKFVLDSFNVTVRGV